MTKLKEIISSLIAILSFVAVVITIVYSPLIEKLGNLFGEERIIFEIQKSGFFDYALEGIPPDEIYVLDTINICTEEPVQKAKFQYADKRITVPLIHSQTCTISAEKLNKLGYSDTFKHTYSISKARLEQEQFFKTDFMFTSQKPFYVLIKFNRITKNPLFECEVKDTSGKNVPCKVGEDWYTGFKLFIEVIFYGALVLFIGIILLAIAFRVRKWWQNQDD
jgi:hypothetical protein